MRMLLKFAAAILMVVPLAMASTTTCPTSGTLDLYLVPSFTCITGNLVFSNFSYSASAAPPGIKILATGISVVPLTFTGDEGFTFTSSWSALTQSGAVGSFLDSTIFYTVSTVNHAATIDDLFLSDNGVATGTGLASVTEQWCANNAIPSCPIGGLSQIFVSTGSTPNNATAIFSPISSLSVSKDISVSSGTNGTAAITTVSNNFSQTGVPEPMSCLLLGSGLLGIGLLRKRQGRLRK